VTTEGAQELRHAIAQFPEEQVEMIVTRFADVLSHANAGDVMGRSEAPCQVIRHRGLRALTSVLANPKNRRPKAQTIYGVPVLRNAIATSRKQAKDLLTTPGERPNWLPGNKRCPCGAGDRYWLPVCPVDVGRFIRTSEGPQKLCGTILPLPRADVWYQFPIDAGHINVYSISSEF
jgi:hypothetical protein